MKTRVLLLGIASALLLGACEDEPTELAWPLPVVTSSSPSYTVGGQTFTITNPAGGDVLFIDRCSGELQRRTASSWEMVVGRTCSRDPSQNRQTVRLDPGAQLTDASFASVVLDPGQYRALFFVSTDTTAILRQAAISNTFSVLPTGGS